MKHIRIFAMILSWVILAFPTLRTGSAEEEYGPGLTRVQGGRGYEQAEVLAEKYGIPLTDGRPLYAPARPQPMNAYMVTHPDCRVGIDLDDMYPVSQTGLIPEITEYLERWMDDIEAQSGGLIRFVADPNDADVLVVALQSYRVYGEYSGGGLSATGYSCSVTLTAVQLSDPENSFSVTETSKPGDTVSLLGGERFWKTPPDLADTEELAALTDAVLGWYGLGAKKGSRGAGVKRLQQSLIDRGFLKDRADGDFGGKTEAAVKALQEYRGLEPTGEVDRDTLRAVYYDA